MKKRTVKAFDIEQFNTKEELDAEIERINKLMQKKNKKLDRVDKVLFVPFVTGFASLILGCLVSVSAFFGEFGYDCQMQKTAEFMSYSDEFKEIQQEDIVSLSQKFSAGKITKQEFDKEYDKLTSKEYIRSVAPQFCSEEILNKYDEQQNAKNIAELVSRVSTTVAAAGTITVATTLASWEIAKNKNKKLQNTLQVQKNELFRKKQKLEDFENNN